VTYPGANRALRGDGGAGDKPGCGAARRKGAVMAKPVDLLVHGEGSIYLLRPATRRGQRWIDMRISSGRTEWAGAIVVEHRYIGEVVRGAIGDGLRVR
jgi:hypothetical protein